MNQANDSTADNMKAFLKRLLQILPLLVIGWILVVFFVANASDRWQEYCRRYTNIPVGFARRGDTSLLRFREIESYHDVDILFVGSSHCYRGFDTRVFAQAGLNTFNMGSTSQSPLNSYYLLRHHIDHLNPRLMIIEVYPEVLEGSGLESFLDLSENTALSWDIVAMALAVRKIRSLNGLLARIFELGRLPVDRMKPLLRNRDRYIPGGFVEKADDFEGERDVPVHEVELSDRQLSYLHDIIDLAHSRGTRVLLVIQPLPRERLKATLNVKEVTSELHKFAQSADVRLIDFNDLMTLDSRKDFYDSDHLRQRGVEEFNRRLLDLLYTEGYFEKSPAD